MRYAPARTTTLILGAAVLAGAYYAYWYAVAPTAPHAAPKRSPPAENIQRAAWLGQIAAPQPQPDSGQQPSLTARVDRLLASGDPADAFAAFKLIQSCVDFEHGDTGIVDPASTATFGLRLMTGQEKLDEAALCRGITERIKSSRLDHLAVAAKAGVPGAASEFIRAGPFGDPSALASRPDDPLVGAWKSQAIAQLNHEAEQGAEGSMMLLFAYYYGGSDIVEKDTAQSLRYAVALGQILDARGQQSGGFVPNPFTAAMLQTMEAGLTAQQIADAQAAGTRMAQRAFGNGQRPQAAPP